MATVSRAFTTLRRRWVAGEPVRPADDLAPHAFDDLVKSGFIEAPKPATPPATASKKKPRK
ncbi:MAG: hypothetical protein M9944_08040 [Rhizobiaceae bacterium]|nr:hypothetical protein [Rhizobiaceae bacterium]